MKRAYLLVAAIALAAVFGFANHARPLVPGPETLGVPTAAAQNAGASNPASPSADGSISGRVVETIDVSKYTYLRLETAQGEVWAAVSRAPITRGASVTVEHAARMDHFESTTLKRTFDVIYFGSLGGGQATVAGLPPGHPAIGPNGELPVNGHVEMASDPGIPEALLGEPSGALPAGHPSVGQGATAMGSQDMPPGHVESPPPLEAIAVPKLARAQAANGYVIADLFASHQRLIGKRVRVRGMVTKVTLDVLGGTFLHLRDGSGDDATKTNDLAVTTSARPARGDVLIFEGVLRFDADLGIGYRYPALLEKATVVTE